MKRRGFLGKVAGGAAAGAAGVSSAQENPEAAKEVAGEASKAAALVKTPAVLMAPRPDGIEVAWAVSRLSKGHVEWTGEDGGSGTAAADRFGFVPQGEEILRVRIEGLKRGVNYSVRAITVAADDGERVEGGWKKFRTLDSEATETSFMVWNDTHVNEETLKRLHASTPRGDFLVWNGDTCNDWLEEGWLVPTLLHPAGQDVSDGRPLCLVWGNHDVRGKWAYKMPEMIATPDGRPFYAFRAGPVAVICLHTGEDKPDNHPSFGGRVAFEALRREQGEWLRDVTARPGFRDAPYRVVFCHIPLRWRREPDVVPYDSGDFDRYARSSRDLWHEALVAWKAQVVISGHTHEVGWFPPTEAFPYAQLIGGGPQPRYATWIEGKADGNALTLTVKNLDGETIQRAEFQPLA